jgi:hypothetical protein
MLQPREVKTASVIFIRHEISVGILFQRDKGAGLDALALVRDHEIRLDHQLRAEAGTRGHAPCGELNRSPRLSSSIIVPS